MPSKRQIVLQEAIQTQSEWVDFISKDGLAVMDVFSGWCGPCKAVVGLFTRLKNELGDELLRFATAMSDAIESLEPYRDQSEPTFLLYSGGVLVSVVRGALGPQLERSIKKQLQIEHRVLEDGLQRDLIVDDGLHGAGILEDDIEANPSTAEEARPDPTPKQFTVMVIKPDAVQAGKVDEIVEQVQAKGVEVLAKEQREMTKEEAAEFYKQHEGSDHFEELVEFMSSGPCMTLVLSKGDTGEGVIEDIRHMVGPTDVKQAIEEAPDSLRASYGTDSKMNAIHASDSCEMAARELAFFLPKFKVPYVPGTEPLIERTLALIRPEALSTHRDKILEKIHEAGFKVALQKELTLTKEQAMDFYKEHDGKDFFDSLTTHMSSGPMLALCLARESAVAEWRKVLGPKFVEEAQEANPESLRAQFPIEGSDINPLHGTASTEEVDRELGFFFPKEHTLAVIKPGAVTEKDLIMFKIQESGFTISMTKEAQLTKEMAEHLYASHRDSEFFGDLTTMMTSGPSLFMVLTREDAVMGWRGLMGPTDPLVAKEHNPDSVRALYGQSTLDNAVHGSSDVEQAKKTIGEIFKVDVYSHNDQKEEGVGDPSDTA